MVYLDTNVLVYASVTQDEAKQRTSIDLIQQLVKTDALVLSVLSLQELAYALAKIGVPYSDIQDDIDFYLQFVSKPMNTAIFQQAFDLAFSARKLTALNDAVHLSYATHHATKLITFDKDFSAFQAHTHLPIQILT